MTGLLDGLRVLTVDQYGAGPYGGLHLADMGAEVIKIEPPHGGDYARSLPPFLAEGGEDSLFFQSLNRNKKSVAIDLAHPEGRRAFQRLVARSDAVLTNLRGDAATRLGLEYEVLGKVNPRVVCCFLTGFGRSGPRGASPGFDYMVQAESGIMSLAGEPDGPAVKAGVSVIDFSSGIASSLALLAGVVSARQTGRGGDVDVSLQDTASSLMNYVATWYLTTGYETPRLHSSAHPSLVPSQLFRCRDQDIIVMVNKESFWTRLTSAIDRPEWSTMADRATFAARLENREAVVADLEAVFAVGDAADWIERLEKHGVPCARVRTVREAFDSPEYAERTVSFEHPDFGEVRSPGPLVRTENPDIARRAPALGEDTFEVLRDVAELSEGEIDDLRQAGVVRRASLPATNNET